MFLGLGALKDATGVGEVAKSSVKKKKLKEITKIQQKYNKGEISKSDYKSQVKDINRV